jgi:dipeptide/tripeptide permease
MICYNYLILRWDDKSFLSGFSTLSTGIYLGFVCVCVMRRYLTHTFSLPQKPLKPSYIISHNWIK